jgi:CheY-like chemotaxis protein
VCDTGPGVPVEFRTRLFKPFMREGISAVDGSSQGAGLGLALSKRLADLSGARIGHTPAEGGGSCFWVEWPLLPATSDPNIPAIGERDFTALRVLVVEDDALQRDALGQFLEQLGVAAHFAPDAAKAEKLLCGYSFDLVLLDYNLGAHTALSLIKDCEAARFGGHPRPRLVLITAHDPAVVGEAALNAGIESLHRKPLSLSDLYRILAAAGPAQPPKSNRTSP